MVVARRMNHRDVMDRLAELFIDRGVPECLRSDNGWEFPLSDSGLAQGHGRVLMVAQQRLRKLNGAKLLPAVLVGQKCHGRQPVKQEGICKDNKLKLLAELFNTPISRTFYQMQDLLSNSEKA